MLKASQIDTSNVTSEQIGRAHKIIHTDGNFYKVQSSRDTTVEYSVKYDARKKFTCTCPSGQVGFSNCKIGVCSHVLIAMAAAREEEEALAELAAATCAPVATYTTVDQATMARIEAANERAANKPASRCKAPEPRGFSLLK